MATRGQQQQGSEQGGQQGRQQGGQGVEFKSRPKLYYFDMKGRAEAIRLAFHIGGMDFEDVRLDKDTFSRMKQEGQFPYGQLPVLEVDNRKMAQSAAILGWVGHYAKLTPTAMTGDVWREGKVWEFINALMDCMSKIAYTMKETDQNTRMQMRHNLTNTELPESFRYLEQVVSNNKGEFGQGDCVVGGNEVTIADIQLYTLHQWISSGILEGVPKDIMNRYSNLMKSVGKVQNHPKVQEWSRQHPETGSQQWAHPEAGKQQMGQQQQQGQRQGQQQQASR